MTVIHSAILLGLLLLFASALQTTSPTVSAHRDGCHRWHSCPSDTGSYVCGDLGYYSECPGYGAPVYVPPVYVPPPFVPSPFAAFPLSADQGCGVNGRIDVTFRWNSPPTNTVQQQWIDLSLFGNGFAGGTFIGAGPISPFMGEFTWTGLLPDTTHYWRVNALVGSSWLASRGYAFTTGHC